MRNASEKVMPNRLLSPLFTSSQGLKNLKQNVSYLNLSGDLSKSPIKQSMKIKKSSSQMIPYPSPSRGGPRLTSRVLLKAASTEQLAKRLKKSKSPEELEHDIKRLEELGYCSADMSTPIYCGFAQTKKKRGPIFSVADLWGKRMIHQVIRQSGYWEAYRMLKSRGLSPRKQGTELNYPASPQKMDENARRRAIFEKNQRKTQANLSKETGPTLKVKKVYEDTAVPRINTKITRQVKKLILDCDTLQQATEHIHSMLTPPSSSTTRRLQPLSSTERRLFDRLVSQL